MDVHSTSQTNVLMEVVLATLGTVRLLLCVLQIRKHAKMVLVFKKIKIVSTKLAVCKKAELLNVQMESALILNLRLVRSIHNVHHNSNTNALMVFVSLQSENVLIPLQTMTSVIKFLSF